MRAGLHSWLQAAAAATVEQLDVIRMRDPSIRSRGEAALHPSMVAIAGHRIGASVYRRRMYKTARAVCMLTRLTSGIEIHPGAQIGRRFFVDHGSGVVIGETAVIGDDVTLFQQVTLGSTGWWKDKHRGEGERRHPRLGDGVTVGANATVLGAITIGDNAVVGAQSLVMADVPANGRVYAPRGVLAVVGSDGRPLARVPRVTRPRRVAVDARMSGSVRH